MAKARPITDEDLEVLTSLKLSKSDIAELRAATGESPNVALVLSVAVSDWTEAIEDDEGNLVAVFGMSSACGLGFPWFLCSESFDSVRWAVARQSKQYVKRMLKEKGRLMNFVDSRNTKAVKWLQWLGFSILEDKDFFLHDKSVPFKLFYMET